MANGKANILQGYIISYIAYILTCSNWNFVINVVFEKKGALLSEIRVSGVIKRKRLVRFERPFF